MTRPPKSQGAKAVGKFPVEALVRSIRMRPASGWIERPVGVRRLQGTC